MAENNTNEVDLGLEEEAQVDLGNTSPTTGTSTTQGTEEAPAMSLTEQLAQGLAAAPETPSVMYIWSFGIFIQLDNFS